MGAQLLGREHVKRLIASEPKHLQLVDRTWIHANGNVDDFLRRVFAHDGGRGVANLGAKIATLLKGIADAVRNNVRRCWNVFIVQDELDDVLVVLDGNLGEIHQSEISDSNSLCVLRERRIAGNENGEPEDEPSHDRFSPWRVGDIIG